LLSGATPDPSEPVRDPDAVSRLQLGQALQRAKYAIAWERSWPHLARLLSLAGLFLVVSWVGLWLTLPFVARAVGLGLFVLVPLLRFRWPSREEGLSRLDRGTGIRHRPATALTDTLVTQDPVALALWQAQRERTLASIKRIRAGLPSPRLAIHDPWALRALVAVMMVAAYVAAGDERTLRTGAAFDWNGVLSPANIRVDAWVTPPLYTGRPPIILSAANKEAAGPAAGPLPVPVGSTLIVRSSGGALDVVPGGGVTEAVPTEQAPKGTNERHFTVRGDGTAHVRAPSGQPQWKFSAIPDRPPTISLAKDPERQAAARCRCPTRSRMITASPKPRRISRSAPAMRRKLQRRGERSRGRCSTRHNFRWCFRMRGREMGSARPSRISARIPMPAPTSP
jgi:uncharacterized protein (TIGR02302 family)